MKCISTDYYWHNKILVKCVPMPFSICWELDQENTLCSVKPSFLSTIFSQYIHAHQSLHLKEGVHVWVILCSMKTTWRVLQQVESRHQTTNGHHLILLSAIPQIVNHVNRERGLRWLLGTDVCLGKQINYLKYNKHNKTMLVSVLVKSMYIITIQRIHYIHHV